MNHSKYFLVFIFFLSVFRLGFAAFFETRFIEQSFSNVLSSDWSPNGRFLAVCGVNPSPSLIVYDYDGMTLTQTFSVDANGFHAVQWSNDGRYLALVGITDAIYEFDGSSFTNLNVSMSGGGGIFWSPDNKHLAVGETNVTIYSFDGSSVTQKDTGASGTVRGVAWSSCGRYLAVAGDNLDVYSWSGDSLTLLVSQAFGDTNRDVFWHPSGDYLAVCGNVTAPTSVLDDLVVYSWDGSSLTYVTKKTTLGDVNHVDWSHDGNFLAVSTDASGHIVYSWENETLTREFADSFVSATWFSCWGDFDNVIAFGGAQGFRVYRREKWLDGTLNSQCYDQPFRFSAYNAVIGDVKFNKGIAVDSDKTVSLNIWNTINGTINLNGQGALELLNDLHIGSYLTGGIISGNGNTLFLEDTLTVSHDSVLHISSDLVINGQGNNIELDSWTQLFVDTDVTLTLRNLKLKTSQNSPGYPPIRLASQGSKLALENVIICPKDDFYFNEGQLFIHNEVSFVGTHTFFYRSSQPSFITSQATWNFAPRTMLYFDTVSSFTPSSNVSTWNGSHLRQNELIQMEDDTSYLYLNQCTLQVSHSGLRLTKGSLFIENHVIIKNNEIDYLGSLTSIDTKPHGPTTAGLEVGWSPSGRFLAIGGGNYSSDFIVYGWDGTSLDVTASATHGDWVYTFDWHPSEKYIAIAGSNSVHELVIFEWDGASLTKTETKDFGTLVRGLSWSCDGKYLGVAGTRGANNFTIYEWDGVTLKSKATDHFSSNATSVSWNSDGRHVAVGGSDSSKDIRIYEFDSVTSTLTEKDSKEIGDSAIYLAWSPDGRYLAAGLDPAGGATGSECVVYEWDGSTLIDQDTQDHGDMVLGLSWSIDGRYLAVAGQATNDLVVYKWDGKNLVQVVAQAHGINAWDASWSPDKKYLAVCGSNSDEDLIVYGIDYSAATHCPAVDRGFVAGNSSLGSEHDLDIFVLSGADLEIQGSFLYDDV